MQQVNLYLPEFQPRREPMNAVQMGLIVLAVLVVIIVWSLFSGMRTSQLEASLESDREQLRALQSEVQALTAQLPARRGASVEEQVAELRAEVRRREQILNVISRQNLGNAEGFSTQLQTLARQSLEDLALSHFALKSGGGYVELAGRVQRAELVPMYLRRLREDESFAEVRFGVLDVAREPDDQGPGLKFSIQQAERD